MQVFAEKGFFTNQYAENNTFVIRIPLNSIAAVGLTDIAVAFFYRDPIIIVGA